jgi:hypothetical protein
MLLESFVCDLASGHADNDIIIAGRRRLPKVLPKKRSETRGDNGFAVVRESPGHGFSAGRGETQWDGWAVTGGQEVAGSNPASPTHMTW